MSTNSQVQAEIEKIRLQGEQDRAWIMAEVEELKHPTETLSAPSQIPWGWLLTGIGAGLAGGMAITTIF